MKIIVCLKQVPNTNEVRINNETGTLIREGVPSIMNPDDLSALEEALKIKDSRKDVHVVALSMGPLQAEQVLREALAYGADEAIHLTDRAFAGSDTWCTAKVLATAIEKVGEYDIIICGRQAIDGDTAQVGPEIAEFLNIPQITYVSNLVILDKKVQAYRKFEDGYFVYETDMPVLLTVIKELNNPRHMDMRLIYKAFSNEANFKVWNAEDINIDLDQIGLKNSPTRVVKIHIPTKEFHGERITGTPKEVAAKCVERILKINI